MAGRGRSAADLELLAGQRGPARGVADRLRSHASGRRSGDQFCIYVCDRLVLPTLTSETIRDVGEGRASLDALTRAFIHRELSFSYVVAADGPEAHALEAEGRAGRLEAGKPLLNPRRP